MSRLLRTLPVMALLTLAGGLTCAPSETPTDAGIVYPQTATVDQVDTYHGVEVADPYRWLEEDVRTSPAVQEWIEAQNEVTFAYLEDIPERRTIAARLRELWNFERYSLPQKEGGRYYYRYNDGLLNQDLLYVQESLEVEPELLIDPNSWSEDGTIALSAFSPSPDGRYLAYTIQDGGSDWRTAKVLDLSTRRTIGGELEWLKFTPLAWAPDGSGFYYSRYPEPASGQQHQESSLHHAVYFHRPGTPQEGDERIYARPDFPNWNYWPLVTEDGRYLVLTIWQKGIQQQVAVQDRQRDDAAPSLLIEGFDYAWGCLGNLGNELLFLTNHDAPRYRIVAIDPRQPEPEHWREVVAERDSVLIDASLVGGHIVAEYLRDARFEGVVFDLSGGAIRTIETPGIGTAAGFEGHVDDPEVFYRYSSFDTPEIIFRYDVESGDSEVFKQAQVDFDPAAYTVEQVFYESRDGTRVPMFLAHHRDLVRDGDRPTLLYGYGGFNVSQKPAFSVTRLAWMEMGGVYAVANLRGGGEYGEEWHQAGTKLRKQNVFDDFIAAAEYLVDSGITRPERLAVFGGSNGGLLVGAVLNQRPDLFAAALPAVGVMDMLRFHLFTAGRFWVEDYGSSDDPVQFPALRAYSPYHNVTPGTEYPAVLVTTADTDDRVVPAHSFKYAAAMQAAQAGSAPVLIRIETRAGHGAGKPTDRTIEEYADRWAFLVRNLGMNLPAGSTSVRR